MINLEFYREKIKDFLDGNLKYINLLNGRFGYKVDYGENYADKFVDWLLEEYKEPIKLKQWEYDMIESNNMSHANVFDAFYTYRAMKGRGYFKGIKDTSMTLKEILDNCEVVE